MKQKVNISFDGAKNSSVAWFKLAELVSRGEKEKALNLYRLLSHSFEDPAYVLQLEGDILWAFEDADAVDKYAQAAFLYKKEKKITAAIAIYEHLLSLNPNCYDYIHHLIVLYARLDWPEKFKDRLKFLLDSLDKEEVSQASIWKTIEETIGILSLRKRDNSENKESKKVFDTLTLLLNEKIPHLSKKAQSLYAEKSV
jgi:tetratricopeptide (TPR) repeat protein